MKTKWLTTCVGLLGSAITEPKTDVLVLILCDVAIIRDQTSRLEAVAQCLSVPVAETALSCSVAHCLSDRLAALPAQASY